MKHALTIAAAVAVLAATASTASAQSRDQIRIVGSSTVYPFATVVVERFGQTTPFKTPVIESTGSGGGIKLFCGGVGLDTPDITNSSRRIKSSEVKNCNDNGVTVVEFPIGYDGIVVANSVNGPDATFTKRDLWLALAKEVPMDGKLVANPYRSWKDVNSSLPDERIEVLGPPPTSGTRDAFVELVMEEGCQEVGGAKELGLEGKACHVIREDGAYVEAGENDNLIVQKLDANPSAFGVFGYSFLEENMDKIKGHAVGGVAPTFETIASGQYPVSRPLFFYVKKEHVGVVPGIEEYVRTFASADAMGEDGYLVDRGLIPLDPAELEKVKQAAETMPALSM